MELKKLAKTQLKDHTMKQLIVEDARKKLLPILDKIAKEQDYKDYDVKAEEITEFNITSIIFDVKLNAPGRKELKLFAKVAIMNADLRKACPYGDIYAHEIIFYTRIKKQFERLQEKHCVPDEHRLILPKYYGSNDVYLDEVLVLGNVETLGFVNSSNTSVDLEYVSTVIGLLAKFHALSRAYQKDDPDDFKEVTQNVSLLGFDTLTQVFYEQMLPGSLQICTDENREIVDNYFKSCDQFQVFQDIYYSTNNMFIHGDVKVANFMQRRVDGKLQLIPLDFQMLNNGNNVVDLLLFIFMATGEEFQRQYYHQLLDLYYKEMRAALERLHLDPDEAYPEDHYRKQLEQAKTLGMVIGVLILPVATADGSVDLTEDGVNCLVVKKSQLYIDRFNGIVNNYRKWGFL